MKHKIEISSDDIKSFMEIMEAKTIEIASGMEFETEGELKAYIEGLKMAQGNMNEFMNFVIRSASFKPQKSLDYRSEI